MPNKTIYVSDEDLKLFQRAQELVGGNLSGAIVTALRRFIELEEGRVEGYDEVILKVGRDGVRQVRFSGQLLTEWHQVTNERIEDIRVYRTRKGAFAVHSHFSNFSEMPTDVNILKNWKDMTSWRRFLGLGEQEWGDFNLDVVDTVEEVEALVPPQVYARVVGMSGGPIVEDLDI
ncbi:EXLDI protein [Nocardia huaxiensis]|uniref:EXLDI protein n=1 Tax=Nocardia huaxiensis TaxID=2755382 RepID=A0A7D6VAN9_9NOCA|nr:EXLDI protein [Nocardia huaxiensis]QLY30914.1 EXLDI protein [Nocardia huaxiensis]UFS94424.1 EXLDI protein [Nocardia huaxiensis]